MRCVQGQGQGQGQGQLEEQRDYPRAAIALIPSTLVHAITPLPAVVPPHISVPLPAAIPPHISVPLPAAFPPHISVPLTHHCHLFLP
jgi:hypothetical protein